MNNKILLFSYFITGLFNVSELTNNYNFKCPDLFNILSHKLGINENYWNEICLIADDVYYSGDNSGDILDGELCNFECNDYKNGCYKLNNYIFQNEYDINGWISTDFMNICLNWQDYISTPEIISTFSQLSSTVIPSTAIPLTENTIYNENKYNQNGELGILSTLGLILFSALGVFMYFSCKKI